MVDTENRANFCEHAKTPMYGMWFHSASAAFMEIVADKQKYVSVYFKQKRACIQVRQKLL